MPPKLRWKILRRDGFRCTYCGRAAANGVELEVDHIVSWADGGNDDPSNLTTACNDCNAGKREESLPHIDFAIQEGDSCPTRLFVAWVGISQYGYTSYDYTWRYIEPAFRQQGTVLPPRDRRDNKVWTMFSAAYQEWMERLETEAA